MKDENYQTYYRKVLKTLHEEVQMKKLNAVQLVVILLSISGAQTREQLKIAIEKLVGKYPRLEEVDFKERAESRIESDEVVQRIIAELIKGGKSKKASEFSIFAEGHDLEEVKKAYSQYF